MANEQYGFFVDTTRCIMCWGCTVACKQWNGIQAGTVSRRNTTESFSGTFPRVKRFFMSLSCMHCESPACAAFCPEGAITKREEDGIVVVDRELCTGCGLCVKPCPFDVPQLRIIEGREAAVMDKCDTCLSIGRQSGEEPHCVATCPLGVLHFGPLAEMEAKARKKDGKRMEGMTGPSVFVV